MKAVKVPHLVTAFLLVRTWGSAESYGAEVVSLHHCSWARAVWAHQAHLEQLPSGSSPVFWHLELSRLCITVPWRSHLLILLHRGRKLQHVCVDHIQTTARSKTLDLLSSWQQLTGLQNDCPTVLGQLHPFLMVTSAHRFGELQLSLWMWLCCFREKSKSPIWSELQVTMTTPIQATEVCGYPGTA